MIHEYILTIFKVIVGVITNERLAIAALIAFGVLTLWVVFSLCFSFQMRFISGSRKINDYISRNGISKESRGGLFKLVQKMPSEFVRGFLTYEKNPKDLPSQYIKRSECLDLELTGGVFNQNKSVIKSFINMVFFALLIFSFAVMSNSSSQSALAGEGVLTGYAIAEACLIPFLFLTFSKLLYYVYTSIRQHQYNVSVEEFNDMIDNFDKASIDVYNKIMESEIDKANYEQNEKVDSKNQIETALAQEEYKVNRQEKVGQNGKIEDLKIEENFEEMSSQKGVESHQNQNDVDAQNFDAQEETQNAYSQEAYEPQTQSMDQIFDLGDENVKEEKLTLDEESEEENQNVLNQTQEEKKYEQDKHQITKEEEQIVNENQIKDNYKPDFASLLDEPVQTKRGRGRPKKETSGENGIVIKSDKEFEDALVRAEKLMRKNEEPLSASQTKRIEKQLKELIDAMSKYKENK